MKDVECAETKGKSYIRYFLFLFFELWWKFIENLPYFYKNDHDQNDVMTKNDVSENWKVPHNIPSKFDFRQSYTQVIESIDTSMVYPSYRIYRYVKVIKKFQNE